MDYTLSDSYFTHTGTGQRMHKEVQAVPTAVSDKDMNSLLWSVMEVVKAGGLAGVQFDPDVPSTYNLLLRAIENINAAASSDLPGRVGIFLQPNPPPGWMRMNGFLLSRVVYARLWAHVQIVGAVSDAEWMAGRTGWFSAGDGSTTFRVPLIGAEFVRAWDDGRGVDFGRLLGSWQDGSNALHNHPLTDPTHGHPVNDPSHAHGGTTAAGGAHDHGAPWLPLHAGDIDATGSTPSQFSLDSGAYQLAAAPEHIHNLNINGAATGVTVQNQATGITLASQGSEAKPRNVAWPFYLKY
ncbi:phage tail protein [Variovorax paradoxus]|uniref:Uncharacterized protein n=1 Tax=Variovorax paradoxus TaxID=34073 RepID=A0A0H2MCN6_VARPD|nr:phage tail protein [Variovorax paradoxus]KLN54740.1 hypothetical protein VPARA_40440 [Variovorax paradoxus]